MTRNTLWVAALLLCCSLLPTYANTPITIFTIGDSTMANKSVTDGKTERGWGQMLDDLFTEDVTVDNHAVNGRSSKSFLDEGRWEVVLEKIKPGDYVLIQFGHNDEKDDPKRHTEAGTTFDDNLRRYVLEARERGAIPVLFNSIVRRNFGENAQAVADDDLHGQGITLVPEGDTLIDTHGAYSEAPRQVAAALGVPFIDATAITHQWIQTLGTANSKKVYLWVEPGVVPAWPEGKQDNTHLSVEGATAVAQMLVEALVIEVPALKPYLRSQPR